jgi:hypothetical protein
MRSRLFIISALSLCILAVTATLSIYYAQGQGMCLKSARVLSEHELRQAVLINLINSTVENTLAYNWNRGNDYGWVGIGSNSPAQEIDIQKIINTSFNNEKSFEENFGIKVLLNGRMEKKITVNQILEPFLLIDYDTRPNGTATIYPSSDIREIPFAKLKAENKADAKHLITRYKQLLGYGNHYFSINFFIIGRECCDNRDKDSKEYLEKKQEIYDLSISSADLEQRKMLGIDPFTTVVSNCGDIMKNDNDKSYFLFLSNIFEDKHP